jgi:Fur family transcriptional regulator, ferric uptake regulator
LYSVKEDDIIKTMEKIDLRSYGLRKTIARETVLLALEQARFPLTAETIYKKTESKGEDLSTVYRVLSSFEKCGIVKREMDEKGENSYILTGAKHSHVIVCVRCHKKTFLSECPYEKANEKISEETGYSVFDHNVQLFGLCPDCLEKEKKNKKNFEVTSYPKHHSSK